MSVTAFRRLTSGAGLWILATAGALAAEPASWPDSFVGRLEALALIESLNADLLAHDSATLTLERWCADHRLADPASIVAERVHDVDKSATAEVRAALDVKPDEKLGYRRVKLKCGDHVLSEADNWYVPARLTPEMNHVLETTDTPFGKAVAALHFRRHTLSADLLWRPLPKGWEMGAAAAQDDKGALAVPDHVLEHRAVLSLPDGEPFSEVVETYTGEVLAFPPPK
jgi:chorismate-pyruvate lyase